MKVIIGIVFRMALCALVLFAGPAYGAECTSVFSDTSGVNEKRPAGNRLTFDTSGWAGLSGPWPSSGAELSSGDYYYNSDNLPNDYELSIATGATVRIFVDGDLKTGNESLINSSGAADELLLLVNGKVDLKKETLFTGLLYATDKIKLGKDAGVVGVMASESEIDRHKDATFSRDSDAVNADLLTGLCETSGSAPLPVVDTFESYSPGSIDGLTGGTGWGGPWSGKTGQTLIDTSTDPLLFQADNGLSIRSLTTLEVSDNDNRMAVRPLDGNFTGDSLYMSMLVRFEGTPENNNFLAFWVQSAGFGDSPQFGVKVNEGGSGTDDFFVRLDTNADYSTNLVPGQTYLLVAQFEKDGAGYFNRGRLWVDPQCTDAPPPATSAFVNNNPSSKVTDISKIGLRSFNLSNNKQIQVGQVAAGEQWTDVVQCQCLQNGLEATFYNNYNDTDDPLPSDPDLTRLDSQVDFNWGNGSPDPAIDNNDFAVQWQGSIKVPETGDYRFRTRTDDGVRLWIDGAQVIDDWQNHSAKDNTTGDISLEKGERYSVRMQFYEDGGQASAILSWLRPGTGGYEVIPEESLFACLPVASPQLVSGVAECGAASLVTLEFAQTDRTRELASSFANNPANYQVENLVTGTGIDVQAATLDESGYRVQLDLATALDEETYEITVSNLRDTGGLEMAPNPDSVEVSAQTTGLTATYWNNRYLDGDPVVTRNEANINNEWGRGSPIPGTINNNLFSVRWTGYIRAPETGSYRFQTRTDDGVRLWVNNMSSPIIDQWVNQSPTRHNSGTIELNEGELYEIRMEMYENYGGAVAQLRWETPTSGFEIVPGSVLFNCPEALDGLDHFRISHSGSAVTCQPSPVTIQAMNADGAPVADYEGTVSLSTSTGNGDWLDASASAGTLTRGAGNSGTASYSFVPADGGVITLNLSHTLAQTVNVDLDDTGTGELPEFDPDIDFDETGFIFHEGTNLASPIPQQIAGRPSTTSPGAQDLRLSAVRTNDDTGACEAFLTGIQTIEMGYVCDSPGSCALSDAVTVNDSTVASNNSGGMANSSPVTFDFGDDTVTSAPVELTYADAGRIRLFAELALKDAEDKPTGGEMLTKIDSSNLFVSVPAGFCIEAIDPDGAVEPTSECTGDPAQCSKFTSAGSDFDVRYRAVAWQTDGESGPELCTDNSTTPGFEKNSLALDHELLAPDPDLADGEAGVLGLEQVSFETGQQGEVTVAQSVTEVGVFKLQVIADQAWLGTTLPSGESYPIGRLIPASFSVAKSTDGKLAPVCKPNAASDGFQYSGQLNPLTTGEEIWETKPELLITALNTLGETTTNYTRGDFRKLVGGGVTRTIPDEDSLQMDADDVALMELNFIAQPGTVAPVPGKPGQMTYQFSEDDSLFYPKSKLSLVAPFHPALSFDITRVKDSDEVTASTGLPRELTPEADFELRYGRLNLENAYGPETIELEVPLEVQIWNGTRFVQHTDENCWTYNLNEDAFVDYSESALDAGDTEVVDVSDIDLTLFKGQPDTRDLKDYRVRLSAPGVNNVEGDDKTGILVRIATGNSWLKDFWDPGQPDTLLDPSAIATFGVYRGHDRVIYWQEVLD